MTWSSAVGGDDLRVVLHRDLQERGVGAAVPVRDLVADRERALLVGRRDDDPALVADLGLDALVDLGQVDGLQAVAARVGVVEEHLDRRRATGLHLDRVVDGLRRQRDRGPRDHADPDRARRGRAEGVAQLVAERVGAGRARERLVRDRRARALDDAAEVRRRGDAGEHVTESPSGSSPSSGTSIDTAEPANVREVSGVGSGGRFSPASFATTVNRTSARAVCSKSSPIV